jgi:hypothetical protein
MRGKAQATLEMEQAILDIVEERAPITVRGVCYALFVQKLIPSMEVKHTAKISRIMTRMRVDDDLDWQLIVDGSRSAQRVTLWNDPDEIIRDSVANYRRDNWQEQPKLVEVWSEKSTVEGILEPVLNEFGVTFRVMKGFTSFTAAKQACVDSQTAAANAQQLVALYIGDWDPSGLFMSEVDLPKRLGEYDGDVELQRIAILRGDIERLPHFNVTTKRGDPRYRWFRSNYGQRCWELDALDPRTLRGRVRTAIASHIDRDLWNQSAVVEKAEIESMERFHAAWQAAASD